MKNSSFCTVKTAGLAPRLDDSYDPYDRQSQDIRSLQATVKDLSDKCQAETHSAGERSLDDPSDNTWPPNRNKDEPVGPNHF